MTTDLKEIDARIAEQQASALRLLNEANALIEQAAKEIKAMRPVDEEPNDE